ncbi:MAG: TetR family transcriptional regulator [Bryobacterales bacterium]|nr:TetR family transcriptional regulator [Bryobacterales bacterium]
MSPAPLPSTKDRILDAAELLFADHGFDATSLRMITAHAGVNLAAVNYHFQSKEALLDATVARRATPINRRRLELLARYESEAGDKPVPVENLLDAFLRPILEAGCMVPRLMVRMLYLEQKPVFKRIFQRHLQPIVQRFTEAFGRSLPHLPQQEVMLRMQFVLGAFAQLMSATETLHNITEGRFPALEPSRGVGYLIAFSAAGLKSPAFENTL